MEMDSVDSAEPRENKKLGLNPGTSAIPVVHAPIWANSPFAVSQIFRSSCSHALLILGLRGFSKRKYIMTKTNKQMEK